MRLRPCRCRRLGRTTRSLRGISGAWSGGASARSPGGRCPTALPGRAPPPPPAAPPSARRPRRRRAAPRPPSPRTRFASSAPWPARATPRAPAAPAAPSRSRPRAPRAPHRAAPREPKPPTPPPPAPVLVPAPPPSATLGGDSDHSRSRAHRRECRAQDGRRAADDARAPPGSGTLFRARRDAPARRPHRQPGRQRRGAPTVSRGRRPDATREASGCGGRLLGCTALSTRPPPRQPHPPFPYCCPYPCPYCTLPTPPGRSSLRSSSRGAWRSG